MSCSIVRLLEWWLQNSRNMMLSSRRSIQSIAGRINQDRRITKVAVRTDFWDNRRKMQGMSVSSRDSGRYAVPRVCRWWGSSGVFIGESRRSDERIDTKMPMGIKQLIAHELTVGRQRTNKFVNMRSDYKRFISAPDGALASQEAALYSATGILRQ